MNRKDIICMARKAGCDPHDMSDDFSVNLEDLERFAGLVAAAEREACAVLVEQGMGDWLLSKKFADLIAAAEREACAQLVDHILCEGGGTYGDAIRRRSE